MIIKRIIREEVNEPLEVTGITLLSIEEYEAAKEHIPLINGWWWLRSPGPYSNSAASVDTAGWVNTYGALVSNTSAVVRPALQIKNLESFNLKQSDQLVDFCNFDWTVISDSLAICNTGIGMHCFRGDWRAPDANIYEKSDVKTWLEDWAKKRGIIDAL